MPLCSPSVKAFRAPEVSQVEIDAFHSEHFSDAALSCFARDFLLPQSYHDNDQYNEDLDGLYEEEDDALGYYDDGVKRTLTDEQIAIFRHSELEALRRVQEDEEENSFAQAHETQELGAAFELSGAAERADVADGPTSEAEDGELESDFPGTESLAHTTIAAGKQKRKKRRKKNKNGTSTITGDSVTPQKGEQGWFKKTIKPDLRKRTWDVVEAGMDSLDYGEDAPSELGGAGQVAQRRRISYDD